jgi:hypothetical protein
VKVVKSERVSFRLPRLEEYDVAAFVDLPGGEVRRNLPSRSAYL